MSDLWYRPRADVKELQVDECTIYLGRPGLWLLAWRFRRKTDGKPERRVIPVSPNEGPQAGPTWGLKRIEAGRWQISPSIQCIDRVVADDDPKNYKDVETWHETPAINGVPEDEPWCTVGAFLCRCVDAPSSTA